MSLSRRSARRHLGLLTILLLLSVSLGFIVSNETKLSKEISDLTSSSSKLDQKVIEEIDTLESAIGKKKFSEVAANHQKNIAQVQDQLRQHDVLLDKIWHENELMSRLSFGLTAWDDRRNYLAAVANKPKPTDIQDVRNALQEHDAIRRSTDSDLLMLRGELLVSVINSSFLPILLGIMGACTYVIRLIADEIKDTRFSRTSPTQHVVRVALGGLAGVVVGYGVVASTLSQSALAFIAGYAVEPVFATFDSIAEKFRR